MKIRKTIFWLSYIPLGVVFIIGGFMELIGHGMSEACHKWEAWILDYKNRYPDMKYKGDGIWSNIE